MNIPKLCDSAASTVTEVVAGVVALENHENLVMHDNQHITTDEDDTRTNDGKCDPWGRLWFGTMTNTDPLAPDTSKRRLWSLFRLDGTGGATVLDDVSLSNGLAWNADLGVMYYIDSLAMTVDAFDFDAESGKLSNRRSVFNIADAGVPGFLDGMTIDTRFVHFMRGKVPVLYD